MPRVVADSSSLILLAKCSLLETVCDLFEVTVPSAVIAEVASENLVRGYTDAALISDLISRESIRVQDSDKAISPLPISLHQGEKQALLLALNMKDAIFATDDGKAIRAARFLKVPFIIAPKIVVELFRLERISFKKARESLEKLGKIGRYSPDIIADAIVSIMEERNGKTDNYKDT